jgi:hypothetical protein
MLGHAHYRWLADADFSARGLEAQSQGVELLLVEHENRLAHVYDKALDDAANKPLVDLLKKMSTTPVGEPAS